MCIQFMQFVQTVALKGILQVPAGQRGLKSPDPNTRKGGPTHHVYRAVRRCHGSTAGGGCVMW